MPGRDRTAQVVVLGKTKLGESDLILHLMDSTGAAVKAIAKGARKPRNANSARLELFNKAQVTLAAGKNLDIVKEVRLLSRKDGLAADPLRFAAASTVVEAARSCIQPDLEAPRLFEMTEEALRILEGAPERITPLLVSAFLLKITALLGMRPSFSLCAGCGTPLGDTPSEQVRFSYRDGGALCRDCSRLMDSVKMPAQVLIRAHEVLMGTFEDMSAWKPDACDEDVLQLSLQWFTNQTASRLRSSATFCDLFGCAQVASGL